MDIKNTLEHCIEWNCVDCPNEDELGSGNIVCRARLLPKILGYINNLEAKLAESETDNKALICDYESRITKHQELMSWLEHDNEQLKQELAEKKMHLLDENEFQRYCAYKHIEPQIKGCLDREIAYEKEIEELKQSQNQIAIEKLENLKEIINNNAVDFEKGIHIIFTELLIGHIDNKIKILKGENYGKS